MPFDDLDLEFEDEEESKKKKNDAVQVDVDLEFQAPEGATKPKPQPQRPPDGGAAAGAARPVTAAPPARPGEVRKIEDARVAQAQAARRPPTAAAAQAAQPRVAGANALDVNMDLDAQSVVEMREEVRKVQLEADVRVAVAEFKTEYLTEMLSDMKLAEHQINQLLIRINAKHPDMKNEVLMIKKILADFVAKKRK